MRWGRLAVAGLAALVGLGLGLIVAEPWQGPTAVGAVELRDDEAWREEDAADVEVRDDNGDDGDPPRTLARDGGAGAGAATATTDGRDGTREGDTRGSGGTGTLGDGWAVSVDIDSNTNAGGGSASGGGDT